MDSDKYNNEMNMNFKKEPVFLLFDFRFTKIDPCLEMALSEKYKVISITSYNEIDTAIDRYQPTLVFFDFDLPDQHGLSILNRTKYKYPSLPFIMLTDDHSTELAIWALRSRAWNYFVKPLDFQELFSSIEFLLEKLQKNNAEQRNNFMPKPVVPSVARPYKCGIRNKSTLCAVDYVRQHLEHKITVDDVSQRCGMSRSHFSRSFKKEHGITFQDFLIQQRVNKAVGLLKNTDLHVTQIAFSVGYCELSNFTATFQRIIGVCPSGFRKSLQQDSLSEQQYS